LQVPENFLVDGSAIWIQGFYPYWTPLGEQELWKMNEVPSDYFPLGTSDIFDDAAVRIVEICDHPLGKFNNLVVMVELVHRKKWMQILRFAILEADVFFAIVLCNDDRRQRRDRTLPAGIKLYGELVRSYY
jgi:hypothetical protein